MQPKLVAVKVPAHPAGAVLVLHGGDSRRANMMVIPTQLAIVRMIPIARRIARGGRGQLARWGYSPTSLQASTTGVPTVVMGMPVPR